MKERTQKINKMNVEFFKLEEEVMSLRNIQEESLIQGQKISE